MRLILILAMLTGCAPSSTDKEIDLTISRGNKIVVALEAYKLDVGDYPDQLSELVPKYIDPLPPAPRDDVWLYGHKQIKEGYFLGYDWGTFDVSVSTSGGQVWNIDTK